MASGHHACKMVAFIVRLGLEHVAQPTLLAFAPISNRDEAVHQRCGEMLSDSDDFKQPPVRLT